MIRRSKKPVARELAISPRTVDIRRAQVMEMRTESLFQLVRRAFSAGTDPGVA